MSTVSSRSDDAKVPDLTLKSNTLDFFYAVTCGYTPDPEVSLLLASNTDGLFSDEYEVAEQQS